MTPIHQRPQTQAPSAGMTERVAIKIAPSTRFQAQSQERCPYCHDRLEGLDLSRCPSCSTPHHRECLTLHSGCAVHGCRRYSPRPVSEFFDSPAEWRGAEFEAPLFEGSGLQRAFAVLWVFVLCNLAVLSAIFIHWLVTTPAKPGATGLLLSALLRTPG